jgi:phosphonoacetaldehyde hydrolase
VAAFRQRGLKIGSSTGYTREMMDVVVPEAEKRGYAPDSIVCSSDVPAGRPSPWMALRSAMALGVYPMEAIVKIGDTVPDINEGLNTGMWTIGLAQTGNEVGLTEQETEALDPQVLQEKLGRASWRLAQAGAHYVIDGMWDVLGVLDEIESRLADGERP